MKPLFLLLLGMSIVVLGHAQYVYTINADSVKITNNCDSSELILQNHTQGVAGFLFNTGNGRTAFRRGIQKLNDSLFLIGADTLKVPLPGSGGIGSANNGLTDSAGVAQLGGTIWKTTSIELPPDTFFGINLNNFSTGAAFLGISSDPEFPLFSGVNTAGGGDGYQIFGLLDGTYEQDFYQNDTNMLSIANNRVFLFGDDGNAGGVDNFFSDGAVQLDGLTDFSHVEVPTFSLAGSSSPNYGTLTLGAYRNPDSLSVLTTTNLGTVGFTSLRQRHIILSATTGGTVTVSNNAFNFIQSSGALGTLTITLPSYPTDGDKITVKSQYTITAVTWSAGTMAAPINLTAGQSVDFVFDAGSGQWL